MKKILAVLAIITFSLTACADRHQMVSYSNIPVQAQAFIEKYFKKGMAIGISGRIQTGSYTNKDGVKVYTTDVVVEEAEFVESKNSGGSATPSNTPANSNASSADGFMNIPDGIDEELPFN